MKEIMIVLLIIQIMILLFFVWQSVKSRALSDDSKISNNSNLDEFDVIIAAREHIDIIRKCLSNVFLVGFKNIILCIDGGDRSTFELIKNEYPSITIIYNESTLGKIQSQIKCLNVATKEKILIMDADISLIGQEIKGFVSYFNSKCVDFLCPYSVGMSTKMNSLLFIVAETDRSMRQRIIRAGRDAFGVSNLSGYCMLTYRDKYISIINSTAIQDDVLATINLLQKGYTVKTYHKVVCSEIERTTFKSYLMQKTRWTAGNIALVSSYYRLFKATSISKAFAFTSSFLLWYWSQWVDFIAIIVSFIHPIVFIFILIEGLIKLFALINVYTSKSRCFAILAYILLWPIFSTICLVLSPYYLLGKLQEHKTRR